MGIGDWGIGIEDWKLGPITNTKYTINIMQTQSPQIT